MIYFLDSESWKRLNFSTILTYDEEEILLTTQQEHIDFFDSLNEEDTVVTYNGLGYDWYIWRGICTRFDPDGGEDLCEWVRELNDKIIGTKYRSAKKMYYRLKEWYKFKTLDIKELHNMYAGLKRSAASFGYPDVMETGTPFDYEGEFTPEMVKTAHKYGFSDCKKLKFLFDHEKTKKELLARTNFQKIFGKDVYSLGRARAVTEIVKHKFEEATGKDIFDCKEALYIPPTSLHFGHILSKVGNNSAVTFKDPILKEFRSLLLDHQRPIDAKAIHSGQVKKFRKENNPTLADQFEFCKGRKLDIRINFEGKDYDFKEGGLHLHYGEDRPFYESDDRYQLLDFDFDAYYPGLLDLFDIFPKWMLEAGFDIGEFYKGITKKNLEEKYSPTGDKDIREVYKIYNNLFYGKYAETSDPLYDPRLQIKTCLSGQLVILKLIELCERAGVEVIYANTDGICARVMRGYMSKVERICEQMKKVTRINIKPVKINYMFIDGTNGYMWEMDNGYVKAKGSKFNTYLDWSNPSLSVPVVKKSISKYLLKGIPVEDTIRSCTDMLDFCTVKSVGKKKGPEGMIKGKHMLGSREMPEHVRYYHSTNGETLYTILYDESTRKQGGADRVHEALSLPDKLPENIDYDYYIEEAKKRIGKWKPVERLEDIFNEPKIKSA